MKMIPKDESFLIDFKLEGYIIWLFNELLLSVTYPEFFGADWYTHWTHEDVTMVGTKQGNFQNLWL